MEFSDRVLQCSDCSSDFIFTAGEQLFFHDKQFKNDPKRCKPCKAKRSGTTRLSTSGEVTTLPLSRTETRTECSACGVETTVPFKPTQGRPVLCRSCFQLKRVPSAIAAAATLGNAVERVALAAAELEQHLAEAAPAHAADPTMQQLLDATPASVVAAAEVGDGAPSLSVSSSTDA